MFASVLTVAALPAVWLVNRDSQRAPTSRPNVAAVGLAAEDASAAARSTTSVDPMGTLGPLFLDARDAARPPKRAPVAVGTHDADLVSTAVATYSRSVGSVDSCGYDGIEVGTVVEVVNPATGRSVECRVGATDADEGELVLHPDRFPLLAELSSAPVLVEIHE